MRNHSIVLESSKALLIYIEQINDISFAKAMTGEIYNSRGHSKGILLVDSDLKEI